MASMEMPRNARAFGAAAGVLGALIFAYVLARPAEKPVPPAAPMTIGGAVILGQVVDP